MRLIKTIIFLGAIIILIQSCIEPFTPDIAGDDEILIIHGMVTSEEGFQHAQVSWASSFSEQTYKPVNNCDAKIIDGKGNVFEMENYDDGNYRAWIDQEFLQKGNVFKIEVTLENGKQYISEFDTLLPCPEIDSIYYEQKTLEPDNPLYAATEGIQFYIDFDASGEYARNYKWELVETWEYHVPFVYIYAYYEWVDSLGIPVFGNFDAPIDSLFKCWKTNKIKDIFTYTTHQKRDKKVMALPLNITTNHENRLAAKYSILIKQQSLSDISFTFWEQLREQSAETGGLYGSQPYQLKGNIKSFDDENETVLGIFSASTVKTKRFTDIFEFSLKQEDCEPKITDQEELILFLNQTNPETHPIYLSYDPFREEPYHYYDQTCFDCRLKGGTTRKPDYW